MIEKIAYVAEYEGRSESSHNLVPIRESIRKFEENAERIGGETSPALNAKPPERINALC